MKRNKIEVTIPGLPATYNAIGLRSHWVKRKNTLEWKCNVAQALQDLKPDVPFKRAKCSFIRASSQELDFDGLVHSFKPVLDGLVECGVLIDDSPKVIGHSVYSWLKVGRGHGYITIRIEGLE